MTHQRYRYVIIGGGVMGTSTAYQLSKTQKDILIVDQFKIKNDLNSSYDYSRGFRYEYGNDEFYTNLAVESLKLWKKLEKESGNSIYFQTGALLLGETADDYALQSYRTLKRLGHKVELLEEKELRKRYPQFNSKFGVMDYHGGVLDAKKAVLSFLKLAKKRGVKVRENSKVKKIDNHVIHLENGEALEAENIILLAGVWINKLLGRKIVTPSFQPMVYFKPKDSSQFLKKVFPSFAYLDKGFYGFPIQGINAVKIADHMPGKEVDPVTVKRITSKAFIRAGQSFLKQFVPLLGNAKVIKTKICLYDMSNNNDFIIDRVNQNTVIGTGFSGHGFKFAPLIGKMIADMSINKTSQSIKRFKLNR